MESGTMVDDLETNRGKKKIMNDQEEFE